MDAVTAAAQALADACVKPGHWLTLGTDQRAGYVRLAGVVLHSAEQHLTHRVECMQAQIEASSTYEDARFVHGLIDSNWSALYGCVYLQNLAAGQSAAERRARGLEA